ncbi:MAG TPA: hypothetical protein VD838_04795 [Anaeromyxobacteraceae bacterium]|nr:hypothetical protein [Anaeromyxobacteraceae bacterium]
MLKKLAVVLAALPLLAEAQAPQKAPPPPAPQAKPAPPPGNGPGAREERMKQREERMKEREERFKERAARREQRARLARTLGLAEILGLNEQQALKLRDQLANFDTRRERAREQLRASHDTLQRAADEESEKPVSAAEVDQAIQRMFAARAELEAIDRDTLAALPRDLKPDQRARAAIFLQRFSNRFGPDRIVNRKVIRIPPMQGMQGFNFEIPEFRFEMDGPPDFEFHQDLDVEEPEDAEDL